MKKNNNYMSLNTKANVKSKRKSIAKSIGNKLLMLLSVIIPIAILIAYSMSMNFFSITRILSIFVLIISIAAYLKGEIFYPQPKAVHYGNVLNKKVVAQKKQKRKFSFLLKKGTVQVVLSMLIILLCTYLAQVIYKAFV